MSGMLPTALRHNDEAIVEGAHYRARVGASQHLEPRVIGMH